MRMMTDESRRLLGLLSRHNNSLPNSVTKEELENLKVFPHTNQDDGMLSIAILHNLLINWLIEERNRGL